MEAILERLPSILVTEFAWTIGSVLVGLVLTWLFLKIFLRIGLVETIHEVEDDHNIGVGAGFFIFATLMGWLVGRTLQTPVVETPMTEAVTWLVIAASVIIVLFVLVAWPILWMACRRRGEGVLQYVHREVVEEDNGALMLFLGGLLMQITLIVGHITL